MNYYAIGDIHGQFFKLEKLMEKLVVKEDDIIVFLGDYIDRGVMIYETIEYLLKLNKQYNCVFLKGNHEVMLIDYLSGIDEQMFVANGGDRTIKSYNQHGWDISRQIDYTKRSLPECHEDFFLDLKPYYEVDDYIFVHAGIFPGTPLENTPDDILYWDRSFVYNSYRYVGKTVVCGHSPSKVVTNEKNAICIDTGACFYNMGYLTAVKLPNREFIKQGTTLEDLDYENNIGS